MTCKRTRSDYHRYKVISEAFHKWLNMSSHRRRQLRNKLKKERGPLCYYCNKKVYEPVLSHILALTKGGSNNEDNLALAHKSCNRKAVNEEQEDKNNDKDSSNVEAGAE